MGLLRLFLALSVVLAHFDGPFFLPVIESAVSLFFIVSGFYMAMILNEKYIGPGSYSSFLFSRFLRLYPVFFVILGGILVTGALKMAVLHRPLEVFEAWTQYGSLLSPLEKVFLGVPNFILFGSEWLESVRFQPGTGLVLQSQGAGIWGGQFLINPPAWSLGVELLFYLIAPLILRRSVGELWGITLMALILRLWILPLSGISLGGPRSFPFNLSLFLLGALAYRVIKSSSRLTSWLCYLGVWISLLGYQWVSGWKLFSSLPWLYLFFACALPSIFHLTKDWKWDRKIGELSYPIYLCHYPLLELVRGVPSAWVQGHYSLIYLSLVFSYAIFLEYGVARPFDRLRHKRWGMSSALKPHLN